jgi:hypothetical protein
MQLASPRENPKNPGGDGDGDGEGDGDGNIMAALW